MKPIETGCAEVGGEFEALDARALALAAGSSVPLELICPYRYRSRLAPAAAAEADHLPPPNVADIARRFHEIAADSDAMLVESAGGIATPINRDSDFADLAALLSIEVIVVIGNRPGWMNAGILTLKYAESHRLSIAGYILCHVEAVAASDMEQSEASEASFTRLTSALYLGRMRYREPLAKVVVEQLL